MDSIGETWSTRVDSHAHQVFPRRHVNYDSHGWTGTRGNQGEERSKTVLLHGISAVQPVHVPGNGEMAG